LLSNGGFVKNKNKDSVGIEMKIGLWSDLHLDDPCHAAIENHTELAGGLDVLIVAGDLSTFDRRDEGRACLLAFAQVCKHVVVVLGNHDYSSTSSGCDEIVRDWEEWSNEQASVHVLLDDSVVLDGVRFAGGTGWTSYRGLERAERAHLAAKVLDFRRVCGLTMEGVTEKHEQYVACMHDILRQSSEPVVLVSHHLPSWDCIAKKFKSSRLSAAYASHIPEQRLLVPFARKILLAAHGHSHVVKAVEVEGVPVFCHPRGNSEEVSVAATYPLVMSLPSPALK
jgi:predicted phosphodiesterase